MTVRCIIWDGDESTGQWTGNHGTRNLGGDAYAAHHEPGYAYDHFKEVIPGEMGSAERLLTRSDNWTVATWIDGVSWRGPAGVTDLDDAITGMTSQSCIAGDVDKACASKCPYAGLSDHPSHTRCTSNSYSPYGSLADMTNRPANDPQVGHDCVETSTFPDARRSLCEHLGHSLTC